MFIVGIDPGQSGGIAFYNPKKLVAFRTPVITENFVKKEKGKAKKKTRVSMDLDEARRLLQSEPILQVYLEHVSAMPKQGVTGMFRFGQNLGQWQGLLTGLEIEYVMVRPQVWKKEMGLIGADKGDSVNLARKMFPLNETEFKYKTADEGRAEAALIAMYGWEKWREVSS